MSLIYVESYASIVLKVMMAKENMTRVIELRGTTIALSVEQL